MHTVYIDRGDHFEVIADYSGSPRHASLSPAQWQDEYTNGASYQEMRNSQIGSVAGVTPKGTGKWEKDWSAKYVPSGTCFEIASDGALDFDGVPAVNADGVEKHVITVSKCDNKKVKIGNGSEPLRVTLSHPVDISDSKPIFNKGEASFEVGPIEKPCDLTIMVADPNGVITKGSLTVRFK